MIELLLFSVLPYLLAAGIVGSVHRMFYQNHEIEVEWWVSYLIVGLFWPVTIPLAIIVFALRAFDVNI